MGEHGEASRHRPAAKETPLDVDDLLGQILARLPPRPSSLPRASLVCKRWRRLVADPHFLRSFRARHRRPPLLGFFSQHPFGGKIELTPALDPPDRVPAARFTLRVRDCSLLCIGCRHGRVLAIDQDQPRYLVVWDPVTGDQLRLALPPALDSCQSGVHAAVACAARDEGHVHGGCSSSPFQVVAVGTTMEGISACVYSSETGAWGNLISMLWQCFIPPAVDRKPFLSFRFSSTQVGNCICWMLIGRMCFILEFDLGTQSLAVIELPRDAYDMSAFRHGRCQFQITNADSGGLGFLLMSGFSFQIWKRKPNSAGVAGWIPGKTVELSSLLSLMSGVDTVLPKIIGFAEDVNVMLLLIDNGVFMINLETLQFKKLYPKTRLLHGHLFTSFYPIGA